MGKNRSLFWALVVLLIGSLGLEGCNTFGWVDKPSGDTQLLEAARACFDQGDFACAARYYSMVSSASSDLANSESAFLELSEVGATASVFMLAVVTNSGSAGKIVNQLAGSLSSTASEANRLTVFHAYQKSWLISDSSIQGLTRLVTALTLMAEILAEDASTVGIYKQTDLVSNPTLCLSSQGSSGCTTPSGKKLITGSSIGSLQNATDSLMSGSPSLYMIDAAISEMNAGAVEMNSTGALGSASQSFASSIPSSMIATFPNLYLNALLKNGIGTP